MQPEKTIILFMETFAKIHVNIGYHTRGYATLVLSLQNWFFCVLKTCATYSRVSNMFSLFGCCNGFIMENIPTDVFQFIEM